MRPTKTSRRRDPAAASAPKWHLAFAEWRADIQRRTDAWRTVKFFRQSRSHTILWTAVMRGHYTAAAPGVTECLAAMPCAPMTARKIIALAEQKGYFLRRSAAADSRKKLLLPSARCVAEYEAMVDEFLALADKLAAPPPRPGRIPIGLSFRLYSAPFRTHARSRHAPRQNGADGTAAKPLVMFCVWETAMTSTTKIFIDVRPLSPALGAEIRGVDLAAPMDDATFAEILRAWHDHGLILLRGQNFSEDQQVDFGRRFGEVAPWSRFADKEKGRHPYIMLVTNLKENGEFVGSLPEGEIEFHSDGIYIEKPSAGTMLHAVAIPSRGGQTAFASMYKAYDALPADLKAKLEGLKARHAFTYNSQKQDENAQKKTAADVASYDHPVIRTHPATGRKALYVNRLMTERIVGLPDDESRAILDKLFAHIETPAFVYEHEWQVGDVLLWDNRCLVHARRDFPAQELRLMRRLTIAGEKPA